MAHSDPAVQLYLDAFLRDKRSSSRFLRTSDEFSPRIWPRTLRGREEPLYQPSPTFRTFSQALGRESQSSAPRRPVVIRRTSQTWNNSTRLDVRNSGEDPLLAVLRGNLNVLGFGTNFEKARQRFLSRQRAETVKAIAKAEHAEAASVWWYCTHVMPYEEQHEVIRLEGVDRAAVCEFEAHSRQALFEVFGEVISALLTEHQLKFEHSRQVDVRRLAAASLRHQRATTILAKSVAVLERLESEARILIADDESEHAFLAFEAELAARQEVISITNSKVQAWLAAIDALHRRETKERRALMNLEDSERHVLHTVRYSIEAATLADRLSRVEHDEENTRMELWSSESIEWREISDKARQSKSLRSAINLFEATWAQSFGTLLQMETCERHELRLAFVHLQIEKMLQSEMRQRGRIVSDAILTAQRAEVVVQVLRLTSVEETRRSVLIEERLHEIGITRTKLDEGCELLSTMTRLERIDRDETVARTHRTSEEQTEWDRIGTDANLQLHEIHFNERLAVDGAESTTRQKLFVTEAGCRDTLITSSAMILREWTERLATAEVALAERKSFWACFFASGLQALIRAEVRCRAEAESQECRALEALYVSEQKQRDACLIREAETRSRLYAKGLQSPKKFIGLTVVERIKEKVLQVEAMHVGGPSHSAGVLIGDVLVAVNGVPVRTRDDMRRAIASEGEIGKPLQLLISRTTSKRDTSDADTASALSGSGSSTSKNEITKLVRVLCTDSQFSQFDYYFDPSGEKIGVQTA